MTCPDNDSLVPESDYEDVLCSLKGRYSVKGFEAKRAVGWARARSVCGFETVDLGSNFYRADRTRQDIRLDGVDYYSAVFQVTGRSMVIQNGQSRRLAAGDGALVDTAQPVTYISEQRYGQWVSLHLPRQPLESYLGFEPQGGILGHGRTRPCRLLFQLMLDADSDGDSMPPFANSCMQRVIYELVAAVFAPSDAVSVSVHADKLFRRICAIINDRFSDPNLGPCEVATEAGISLRYLQMLFTERGSTCTRFISSVRLDHAERLLRRRELLNTGQPLKAIAYTSGFSEYNHFSRMFRRRFGHSPSARTQGYQAL
jgi:AraC family transcriptional activator of tynA and feaB